MLSYSNIVKQAYYITRRFPVLWVFGLFVVGWANLSFIRFKDFEFSQADAQFKFYYFLNSLLQNPKLLALTSLSVLLASVLGLVVTNLSRIMLILGIDSILSSKSPQVIKQLLKTKNLLWPVIKISLLSTGFMFLIAVALLAPGLYWLKGSYYQNFLMAFGIFLFLPLAFTVSCVNIFSTFFIILHKQNLGKAVQLAIDFFASKWIEILALTLILMAIYAVAFMVGISLIYLAKAIFFVLLNQLTQFGILNFSAIIPISQLFGSLLLWFLLAGLSVFFNTALLLLFLQLITPVEAEKEKKQEALTAPASVV